MLFMSIMSVLGTFVTTAFVANAVIRDAQYDTEGLFFTTHMKKHHYLLGRFCGALVAAIGISACVALALLVGSFMPWIDAQRLGPTRLLPYVFSLMALALPNILLTGGLFFSVATLTRSMLHTYAAVIAFFVAYSVSQTIIVDLESEKIAAWLDPYGTGAFSLATKYWTVAEKNIELLDIEGIFLYNRLLWLGIGALVLGLAYWRFDFRTVSAKAKDGKATDPSRPQEGEASLPTFERVKTAPTFSAKTTWRQYWGQTRMEISGLMRGLPFIVLAVMAILNIVATASVADKLFGTQVYPVTRIMAETLQGSLGLFVILIVTFYSGELIWRERQLKFDEVYNALPVPNWVFWGAKLSALATALCGLFMIAILTAIGIQTYHGYFHYELMLYLKSFLLMFGLSIVLLTVLAFFVQVAVNHKYAGFLVMLLYYISISVLSALDFDHNLYRYAGVPGAPYSDMNGFGHFVTRLFWFNLYWSLAAAALVVLAHILWVRDKSPSLKTRLSLVRQRLRGPTLGALAATLIGFVGVGLYIFYNTNILNQYRPSDVWEDRQVAFEKRYKQYENEPRPKITANYSEVDIYPERRAVEIRGRYTLVNKTDQALAQIHLTINPDVEIRRVDLPQSILAEEDKDLGYYIYKLEPPLAPAAQTQLRFEFEVIPKGFVNNGSNTNLVFNGTFFNSFDYFPHLGYNRRFELTDPNERRKRDLPPIQRMPAINDQQAQQFNYITRESDWIEFETIVSTSADQTALAPGYLQRQWEENGRRYFHYKMDAPILDFFSFLSARWAVERDRWNEVDIEIYYHPDHAYNVRRMVEAVQKSLDYFSSAFSPYQYRQMRILEFPRYRSFAQAFPNTVPFSESLGFIARLDDPDEIDYLFYVTAHEVAHQWWAHQVIGADVQGATLLSETLAQYSALMVMEKEYGGQMMRRFLKYELDRYLAARGTEQIEELPLMLVENQSYIHYQKGSLAMYALRDYIGTEAVNRALSSFVEEWGFRGPPYPTAHDLMAFLEAEVPLDKRWIIEDFFKTITLYDNRATEAILEPQDDGRYNLRLSVESRKYRADGDGAQTPAPVDAWIDIAVFGERGDSDPPEGKVLLLEKHHITDATTVIEVQVNAEPQKAGIDPFNKLVDRNPEDNIVDVALTGE